MAEHPINGLMGVTMDKIRELVNSDTIIGEPVSLPDGTTILPVSRVTFGVATGGSDFAAASRLSPSMKQASTASAQTIRLIRFIPSPLTQRAKPAPGQCR